MRHLSSRHGIQTFVFLVGGRRSRQASGTGGTTHMTVHCRLYALAFQPEALNPQASWVCCAVGVHWGAGVVCWSSAVVAALVAL